MMRKTMALALCLFFSIAVKASYFKTILNPSIVKGTRQFTLPPDTTLLPLKIEDLGITQENLVYKNRLDSIQKTVPLPYNEYVQAYINVYSKRKAQIGKILGLSTYYFPIYEKAFAEFQIPEEIKFLSIVESALDPHAVSKSGATGPWQFMFTTAKGYGLKMDSYVDERKDPVAASYAAAAYFRDAYNEFGDWLLAIAAYNCGKGAVTRAMMRAGGLSANFWDIRKYLPEETRNYVPAFIATAYIMNCYDKHDITAIDADFSTITDVIPVNKFVSLESISTAGNIDLKQLVILNPSYKKRIINGTVESPKRLILPSYDNSTFSALYEALNNTTDGSELKVIAVREYSEPAIAKSKPVFHKVKSGENLGGIANKYFVEVQDLKAWNNLKNGTIVPGQSLKVSSTLSTVPKSVTPQKKYISYTVKPGDTLSEIAEKFRGASVPEIKAKNGLKGTSLQPGMILKINKG